MNRIETKLARIARPLGGLFVGVRVQFPYRSCFIDGAVRDEWTLAFGLLFWQWTLRFRSRPIEETK